MSVVSIEETSPYPMATIGASALVRFLTVSSAPPTLGCASPLTGYFFASTMRICVDSMYVSPSRSYSASA